ncbi:OmpH family outer membrane protein [Arcticibacter sp.]|uniref:OmpH family outer membrane protein n=1 Tax=Arcticibacter sp. TaxID=1872630 RepID=UPI00388FC383
MLSKNVNMDVHKPKRQLLTFLIFSNVFLSVAVVVFLVLLVSNDDKIAYVESAKLLNEYKGAEVARKEFDKKAAEWKGNIDTLESDVRDAMKKYEKELSQMTTRERKINQELINTKRAQLVNYQRAISENAKQENVKVMQKVLSTVNSFLLDYGKKNGYKMILIANESGSIAYAREGLDVTAGVLDELNKEYLSSVK